VEVWFIPVMRRQAVHEKMRRRNESSRELLKRIDTSVVCNDWRVGCGGWSGKAFLPEIGFSCVYKRVFLSGKLEMNTLLRIGESDSTNSTSERDFGIGEGLMYPPAVCKRCPIRVRWCNRLPAAPFLPASLYP